MFTRPYSIYIDKRPMRIAFLVNPESTSLEEIDQIIDYNRSLWGGRFNPIILTDGHTIDDKWWQFLRDIDPDVIKPLVPLDIELIEKFEDFLSPLKIENPRDHAQADLRMRVRVDDTPAGINVNSLNIPDHWAWHGKPILGIFNLDEIEDDIEKRFVLRNFGTYEPTGTTFHRSRAFSVPFSLKEALEQGEVPSEIHEEFAKTDIPFSREVFSKPSIQRPGSWAIIDKENNQIQYVDPLSNRLSVQPETQRFWGELSEIDKKVGLITNRENLATALLEFARTPDIVFRDQICALPNTEREIEVNTWTDYFDVIVGDELQDIVYFWNSPLMLERWKRFRMNQLWLPKVLATDPNMEEALYAWFRRITHLYGNNPGTLRFVSFSTEKQELEDIANRFREQFQAHHLAVRTEAICFEEPQIPKFRAEDLFFTHIGEGMDIHRAQGNEAILELVEPKELSQSGLAGHWMADFYIEFVHNRHENREDGTMVAPKSLYWRFPNRNHLAHRMFDKPSRIRRNGFPSVMMQREETVLRLKLADAASVVTSLFCCDNYPWNESDARTQFAARPYYSTKKSDKGKYLHGVLELFGRLSFACTVLQNAYWRSMFDALSKNAQAEQHARKSIANKVTKWIRREASLTDENSGAIKSLTAYIVDESKKLDLGQREFTFDKFMEEAKCWREKEKEYILPFGDESQENMVDFSFRRENVKAKLAQLTERNIIQIGVKPRCPTCGMVHWYHVDDIGQHLTCQGCRSQFPIHPELTWHYRLNSLIQAAHALHGITPEILVLGQLFEESKTSFLFSPNLDLFSVVKDKSSRGLQNVAEVDIACVQDGKFIIGEVKQSMSLFGTKDFDAMADIAKRAKPNKVLFSCIDSQQPTKFISNHIKRIGTELRPLAIEVTWYELDPSIDYAATV